MKTIKKILYITPTSNVERRIASSYSFFYSPFEDAVWSIEQILININENIPDRE